MVAESVAVSRRGKVSSDAWTTPRDAGGTRGVTDAANGFNKDREAEGCGEGRTSD